MQPPGPTKSVLSDLFEDDGVGEREREREREPLEEKRPTQPGDVHVDGSSNGRRARRSSSAAALLSLNPEIAYTHGSENVNWMLSPEQVSSSSDLSSAGMFY